MTPSRYDSLLRDLTVICRKVFDATPIADAWQDGAIMAEMRRKGSNTEFSVIRGCLENLRKLGLVIETAPRTFQRIREPIPKAKPLMPAPTPENTATTHRPAPPAPAIPNAAPVRKLSTLDRLARISLEFRALADELDDIAIQADEDMKAQGQDLETLRQLQKLLGNIGSRA